MKLEYLKDFPEFIPMLATWFFEEWGHEENSRTLDIEVLELEKTLNKDSVPLAIIAIDNDELVGAGLLKWKEMSIFPEREYWLGGIYVKKAARGNGVALGIIERLIEIAKGLKINKLYLQTERLDGGLYKRMGWVALEEVESHHVKVLVMEKQL